LWDAFVIHAEERDLVRIAAGAWDRSLYSYAFRLYQRAAEAGVSYAVQQAAELRRRAGRTDEATSWYQRAAEAGDPRAAESAAKLLELVGRTD
jgi:TPR repeat protein